MAVASVPGKWWRFRFKFWAGRTRPIRWLRAQGAKGNLWLVPPLPPPLSRWHGATPVEQPRNLAVPAVPAELLTQRGIMKDPGLEEAAFKWSPLPVWTATHPEAMAVFGKGTMWLSGLILFPGNNRLQRRLKKRAAQAVTRSAPEAAPLDAHALTKALKERAAKLGLSAIGITRYDPKYIFEPYLEKDLGSTVIICAQEVNWDAMQSAPSTRSELAVKLAGERMCEICLELADFLRGQGHRTTDPTLRDGPANMPAFAVEAGLGQLGLHGQLLTPFAGGRVRLMIFFTDAPLEFDSPKDYGILGVCDRCKACVRRCPAGAITSVRKLYRGVYKAKIKTERCVPMMVQADGCQVCHKVCPVQRYGLPRVLEEYKRTGKILGLHSDELESYHWPVDGRRYGAGEKPQSAVAPESLHVLGYVHNVKRWPACEGNDPAAWNEMYSTNGHGEGAAGNKEEDLKESIGGIM